MNILFLHNFSESDQKKEIIFDHLLGWSQTTINIWVISKSLLAGKKSYNNLRCIKFLRFVPFWLSFNLWYLFYPHPNFDILIDASKNLPYNTGNNKTVYYFSEKRLLMVKFLNKIKFLSNFFFRSRYFLFSGEEVMYETLKILDRGNIQYNLLKKLPKKISKVKLAKSVGVMNLILIDLTGRLDENNTVFRAFTLIARKNEGWNLMVFTNSNFNKNSDINPENPLFEYKDQIKIVKLDENFRFISKIPKNSILLDTSGSQLPKTYYKTLAINSIPFITTYSDGVLAEMKNIKKLVYTSEEVDMIIGKLLVLSKDLKYFEKIKILENQWALDLNTWSGNYSESLNFIETI